MVAGRSSKAPAISAKSRAMFRYGWVSAGRLNFQRKARAASTPAETEKTSSVSNVAVTSSPCSRADSLSGGVISSPVVRQVK